MFTGLIEKTGRISAIRRRGQSTRLSVVASRWDEPVKAGDSVAVQGVCLTATIVTGNAMEFDVLDETLTRTTLGTVRSGAAVNLERAMRADSRLGGHFVTGHVDGVGVVSAVGRSGRDIVIDLECAADIARGIVMKGSVALDGVSLTVTEARRNGFQVKIIPFTWTNTSLAAAKKGSKVNIETDVIGKYAARYANEAVAPAKRLSLKDLEQAGFA